MLKIYLEYLYFFYYLYGELMYQKCAKSFSRESYVQIYPLVSRLTGCESCVKKLSYKKLIEKIMGKNYAYH